MSARKFRSGFIGPIGDDLPSLIPLLFALLIFFSSFSFSLNKFNQENVIIKEKLELLRIARILRSDGYITNIEEFRDLCGSIPTTSLIYMAGLVDVTKTSEQFDTVFGNLKFIKENSETQYLCFPERRDIEEERKLIQESRLYSLVYPISLEHEGIVVPVHLVVIGWKK